MTEDLESGEVISDEIITEMANADLYRELPRAPRDIKVDFHVKGRAMDLPDETAEKYPDDEAKATDVDNNNDDQADKGLGQDMAMGDHRGGCRGRSRL